MKLKIGIVGKLFIAMVIGVAIGYLAPGAVIRALNSFGGTFGQFIKFFVPFIVIGLVTPAIAEKGKGGYVRASNAEFGLSEIVDEIAKMEKSELSTLQFDEYNEQFYWILWVVLGLLLLEGFLLDRRNPRLRKFSIFEKN